MHLKMQQDCDKWRFVVAGSVLWEGLNMSPGLQMPGSVEISSEIFSRCSSPFRSRISSDFINRKAMGVVNSWSII